MWSGPTAFRSLPRAGDDRPQGRPVGGGDFGGNLHRWIRLHLSSSSSTGVSRPNMDTTTRTLLRSEVDLLDRAQEGLQGAVGDLDVVAHLIADHDLALFTPRAAISRPR